jgi:hypothetical protein
MALQRVILYQNGIGYFERTGHVGGDRILLPFSRHELDDVIKTLTVIDRRGAGVATVETVKELPAGTIDQGDTYLLPVSLTPAKASELVIEEREPRRRTLELLDSPAVELGVYVEGSSLPPGVGDKIKDAVRLRKEMAAVEEQITAARRKLDDVTARSYEIRENLRALEKVRTADDLRRKLVANLVTATQDSDQLTKEITAKSEALAAVRGRLQDAIRDLQLDEPGAPKP